MPCRLEWARKLKLEKLSNKVVFKITAYLTLRNPRFFIKQMSGLSFVFLNITKIETSDIVFFAYNP